MKKFVFLICLWFLITADPVLAFTEPTMAEYQALPVFSSQSVTPNIMIVLDNSGSMNEPAYRDNFSGTPYASGEYPVVAYDDDMEGSGGPGTAPDSELLDLDLGENVVGLRFQEVHIAQGAVISGAYIEFVARDSDSVTTNLVIEGEAADNAEPFSADNTITDRTATSSSAAWSAVPAWTSGTHYNSPDLTAIVQEIVERSGWAKGNAMVFRITGSGERDAYSRDDSSTLMPILHIQTDDQGKRYYGYFNPDYFYEYGSNIYMPKYQKVGYNSGANSWTVRTFDSVSETLGTTTSTISSSDITSGLWDGNWLNWVTSRRVDVLRKVMVGGLSDSRQGGGKQSVNGEDPTNSAHYANWKSSGFTKSMNTSGNMPVCPYHGDYSYYMDQNGALQVAGETTNDTKVIKGPVAKPEDSSADVSELAGYDIKVQKEPVIEPEDFDHDGELAGVLQRIGDKARWGNTWFNTGDWDTNGGTVKIAIDGADMASMISSLSDERCITRTPLAETMYVVMQYFKQEDLQSGLGYPANCLPDPVAVGGVKDPYYNQTLDVMVPCAKSFVILLTDGGSTADSYIPGFLKDADNDGNDGSGCNDCSTNYLDDVAFYARTNDLRSDLEGDQNLVLYTIFAFDSDNTARSLLMDAARNGGFEDRNGNNKPDGDYTSDPEDRLEWDKDGDAVPDTYFEASDGYALESRLLSAITDILKRTASGTAASVLSTNNQGAGYSVQAYFKPLVQEGIEEARWLGYMQSLWVDSWGNLREDSNGNLTLDERNSTESSTAGSNVDKIVEYFHNGVETRIRRYTTHYLYSSSYNGDGSCAKPADCSVASDDLPVDGIKPIFESGKRLSEINPDERTIFTYIDTNQDGEVGTEEVIDFTISNAGNLTPYLGVREGAYWGDGGLKLGSSHSDRVNNLISWIRGKDLTGLRNRTLGGTTWRLGDIINSTPVMVGLPQEYYHELYEDLEYLDFIKYAKNREAVIYVGANDGMLHAFTSWNSMNDGGHLWYEKPGTAGPNEEIGDEIWAYIPQSVLPHLKWTAYSDYSHTYYVDGPVRVFDAKILRDNAYYWDGDSNPNFGTFLVFGLNMGGKEIEVNEDFVSGSTEERTFYPSYVMMDVTDPRNPKLMWEKTYSELGMTTSVPAPLHIGPRDGTGKWYLVFGSGPTEYDGTSSLNGHVFVVDLATGEPVGGGADEWIATSTQKSYFNEALVLDLFQSHNTDAIFIANNFFSDNEWKSDIWKIAVPCDPCFWEVDKLGIKYDIDELQYDADPAEWQIADEFFKAEGPITAQMNSTVDPVDNLLLYAGTGRYLSEADREDNSRQYLYCIKDPFYNQSIYEKSLYHDFSQISGTSLTATDLLNSGNIKTAVNYAGNFVLGYKADTIMGFWDFVEAVRQNENGWYLPLLTNSNEPSERIVTQTSILGGIQITPTFTPNVDICGMGGNTTFVGTYYETGTGCMKQIFDIESPVTISVEGNSAEEIAVRDENAYKGMPAPKAVFHAGQEKGARISTQTGTGQLVNVEVGVAEYFKSIATEWWDDSNESRPIFNDECKW